MMKTLKTLAVSALLLVSFNSYAGSWSGKITRLQTLANGIFYVSLDSTYNNRPACNTAGLMAYHANNNGGKSLLATLMLAKQSGDSVFLNGSGSCNLQSNVETFYSVRIL